MSHTSLELLSLMDASYLALLSLMDASYCTFVGVHGAHMGVGHMASGRLVWGLVQPRQRGSLQARALAGLLVCHRLRPGGSPATWDPSVAEQVLLVLLPRVLESYLIARWIVFGSSGGVGLLASPPPVPSVPLEVSRFHSLALHLAGIASEIPQVQLPIWFVNSGAKTGAARRPLERMLCDCKKRE